jgi:hypothetical protein
LILSEELEETAGRTVRTEQYESLSLGVASQITGILSAESRILHGKVGSWLEEHGLMAGT